MTKLSISLAAVVLSFTFTPSVHAYGTEPAPQTLQQISQITPVGPQSTKVEGACTVKVTPVLAAILGLQKDWRTQDQPLAQSTVACVQQ